jgi:hypothetical protein
VLENDRVNFAVEEEMHKGVLKVVSRIITYLVPSALQVPSPTTTTKKIAIAL